MVKKNPITSGDPLVNFGEMLFMGGVEAQEKRGQQAVARMKDRLPIDGSVLQKELLEHLGFKFGEVIDEGRDQPTWIECQFPEGWSVKPTEHSMHNNVVDDKGRVRARFFFKAAFYDYSAIFYGLEKRYRVTTRYRADETKNYDDSFSTCGIEDVGTGEMIHVLATFETREARRDQAEDNDRKGTLWLDGKYPDHANPLAYWD